MSNSKASTSSTDLDHSKTTRAKFFQRWPRLGELYGHFEKDGVAIDYAEETRIKEKFANLIENKLKACYSYMKSFRESFISTLKNEITNEEDSDEVEDSDNRALFLILDELISYFLDDKGKPRLEIKYFAQRAFQHLRQAQLSSDYRGLYHSEDETKICKDDEIRYLESRITFLSQFFHQEQLAMDYFVSSELDYLAEQVVELLKKKNPSHPLLSVSKKMLKRWNSNGFVINKFDDQATREILDCQCELFKKLGFAINKRTKKDLIDIYEVLESKKGNWQVIFTIFLGVAHRLGVYCRLLNCDELGWRSRDANDNDGVKVGDSIERNYFALDIFESSYAQHEPIFASEEILGLVYLSTVVYDIIPSAVFGELRADLIEILDQDYLISHKYRLSRSSDEDDDSDDDLYGSSDEDGIFYSGPFGHFGSRRRKKKTDCINVNETEFKAKLTAIRTGMQKYEARKQLRAQENEIKKLREENQALKSQIQHKPSSKSSKKK